MSKTYKDVSDQLDRAKLEYDLAARARSNAGYACGLHRKEHPNDTEKQAELEKKWLHLDCIAIKKYNAFLRAEQEYLKYEYDHQSPYALRAYKIGCYRCSKEFYSRNYRRMYCSNYCAEKVYFQRRKDRHHKKLEGWTCPLCKCKFKAKRMNMVYCSNKCRQRAYRERKGLA